MRLYHNSDTIRFIPGELGHQQTPKENKKIAEDQIYQEAVGLAKILNGKDCYP